MLQQIANKASYAENLFNSVADLLAEVYSKQKEETHLVVLDSDIMVFGRFDEIFEQPFDVALTFHPKAVELHVDTGVLIFHKCVADLHVAQLIAPALPVPSAIVSVCFLAAESGY